MKSDDLVPWLASANINAEPELFASLWSFQAALSKVYPDLSTEATTHRRTFYFKGTQPLLSAVVEGKSAECAEIALLAHEWLNRQQLPNQYFSGAVLWKRDHEFSEEHSFIFIPTKRGTIIFDPANPVSTTEGYMPSLYRIDSSNQLHMWEDLRQKQNAFLVLQNEISKTEALYGVSNGSNIDPEKHFVFQSGCERPVGSSVPSQDAKPHA